MGGALASLAAFDIQRYCPCLKPLDVSCYTFGAPRVGNHAFARHYDTTVPDTWNIINNQVKLCAVGSKLCMCILTLSDWSEWVSSLAAVPCKLLELDVVCTDVLCCVVSSCVDNVSQISLVHFEPTGLVLWFIFYRNLTVLGDDCQQEQKLV